MQLNKNSVCNANTEMEGNADEKWLPWVSFYKGFRMNFPQSFGLT